MSHSKRNTSRPVFTSHERALAQSHWNASSARLNRDSFLPFGSCSLCLEIARDPVSCQRGDVFCRECALANILAQKKELKRAEKARKEADDEAARRAALQEDEDRARAIRDFELTQAGLSTTTTAARGSNDPLRPGDGETGKPSPVDAPAQKLLTSGAPSESEVMVANKDGGVKRKFALDEDEVDQNSKADKAKARRAIEAEKAAKPSLPSFWTPSLTPDVHDSKLGPPAKKHKATPMCPASSEAGHHAISLQKLISIQFDERDTPSSGEKQRTCPSCRKALSNATAPVLARHCGHVMCRKCVNQFLVSPAEQDGSDKGAIINCFVCDEPVAVMSSEQDGPRGGLPTGLVALKSEGTGFSARGTSTVEKSGVSFQC